MKVLASATTALLFSLAAALIHHAEAQCLAPGTLVCQPITIAPKLDADLSEWTAVPALTTPLTTNVGKPYDAGEATYKCLYDSEKIYFALEWPGKYRFNADDDHQCPSIATMTKIGADATFVNMGGCPEVLTSCDNSLPIPASCDNHVVDIGAHWETSSTLQGVEYPIAGAGTSSIEDEYTVSPYCRRDDDGANAASEWAGAWTHTANTTIGADGFYRFELSRLLTTLSSRTDAQLVAGNTYSFGIAIWDPFFSEEGWDDDDHYVTGCGLNWIDLVLLKIEPAPVAAPVTPAGAPVVKKKGKKVKPPTRKPTKKPKAKRTTV